jgi:hypothetical protein
MTWPDQNPPATDVTLDDRHAHVRQRDAGVPESTD